MGYGEFKEKIRKALEEFYGGSAEVELAESLKNNGKRHDAVIIRQKSGGSTAPFIYLEEFYQMYRDVSMDMEGCVRGIALSNEEGRCRPQVEAFSGRLLEWGFVRGKVYPALVSMEKNMELLSGLVSGRMLDLSVIYVIRHSTDGGDLCSVKITRGMMDAYRIDEGQLHEQAMDNMKKDGYGFCELSDYIRGKAAVDGGLGKGKPDGPEAGKMYILRNRDGVYGAAGILDRGLLAGFLGGHDCFILPSSIHETIFLLASDSQNQKELDGMVAEINEMCVDEEERLTDHSYYYDAASEEIRICA